jgi:hypothetical protein
MNGTDDIRAKVGVQLVRFSAIALAGLATIVIVGASFTGKPETVKESAQLLVSSLLPVFGTWVGTVLAFYFSKENFEAANRGTIDLVRSVAQRLGSMRVTGNCSPPTRRRRFLDNGGSRIDTGIVS